MWLMAMGLTLGGLGLLGLTSRRWFGARQGHLGWMSEQWLAEHRADTR